MALLNFYSQNGEDEWINKNIILPDKGFYVDIGCGHPFNQSNTAFLRERGWKGLAVDANPQLINEWNGELREHFVQGAVSGKREIVWFDIHAVPEYSRINNNGQIRLMSITLDELVAKRKIDFMSLDVEGYEFQVITGIEQWRLPPVIISEYNTAGIGEDFRVRDYLVRFGYQVVHKTISNLIFLKP